MAAALTTGLLAPGAPAAGKERAEPSGRELYLRECARCHGPEGRGDGPDAPFFFPDPRDLTTGFLARYSLEELVARVRDGTPLSLAVDAEGRENRTKRVEAILAHMRKLPEIDWKDVDAGAVLYGERCEVCHGQFGKPWPPGDLPDGLQAPPRDLRSGAVQESLTDAELIAAFRHGKGAMPVVPPRLDPEEARQLVAFVRLLSPGFEAYSFYCAPCHGDDGRGRGALLPLGEAPKVAFDREFFAKRGPEELRAQVWHMMDAGGGGMPHFKGVLDEASLRQILQYLRGKR